MKSAYRHLGGSCRDQVLWETHGQPPETVPRSHFNRAQLRVTGVYEEMRWALLSRFTLVVAMATSSAFAGQQKQVLDCRTPSAEKLSPRSVKSLLLVSEPIDLSPDLIHLEDTVVLAIGVDSGGKVSCLQFISGYPLIIPSVMDSVSRWKFRSYVSRGKPKGFFGRIALTIVKKARDVTYVVIEAPPY